MRRKILKALYLSMLCLSVASQVAAAEPLTVYFIDVGQGDATLLHKPGGCTMLVDAGPLENSSAVYEVLREAGAASLDYVVITHPHPDHYGGLEDLAKTFTIKELSDNGDDAPAEKKFGGYNRLRSLLPYSVVAAGDSWNCGDLNVEVLHPSPSYDSGKDYNSRSLALVIRYNSFQMLLLGDTAGPGEKELLKSGKDLHATVVQLGHHGANDSTSQELLGQVRPRIAIVSVDEASKKGVPAQQVLERLAAEKIHTYRTDVEGTILLQVSEDGSLRLKP